jgi:hypothetical protein
MSLLNEYFDSTPTRHREQGLDVLDDEGNVRWRVALYVTSYIVCTPTRMPRPKLRAYPLWVFTMILP